MKYWNTTTKKAIILSSMLVSGWITLASTKIEWIPQVPELITKEWINLGLPLSIALAAGAFTLFGIYHYATSY